MERKKLELQINTPVNLQFLFDEPLVGESKFGEYYMYAVKNGNEEYSFFAPLKVHEQLKGKSKKGTAFTITKTATQKGKKLVTDFDIKFLDNGKEEKKKEVRNDDTEYYSAMLQSYAEATKIQSKFSAVNLNQCAVTLFIARTKTNGFNNYFKE
ncbi:MAG: hypothetical protein KJO12_01360 [Ignavibacteria bacterium]|nr:hypothetical protein [Ignavibacteria bacterium]